MRRQRKKPRRTMSWTTKAAGKPMHLTYAGIKCSGRADNIL